jgi:hypothetical protein
MTDEEALKFYEELEDYYGDKLPNFEHYPKQFTQCVKLFRYYKGYQHGQTS